MNNEKQRLQKQTKKLEDLTQNNHNQMRSDDKKISEL